MIFKVKFYKTELVELPYDSTGNIGETYLNAIDLAEATEKADLKFGKGRWLSVIPHRAGVKR